MQVRALKHEIIEILRDGTDGQETVGRDRDIGAVVASFPAHPAVEGQWLARRDIPAGDDYHIATHFRLPDDTAFDAVKRALGRIIARNDALRSTFVERDGQLIQRVHEQMPVSITRIAQFDDIQSRVFDIQNGPLIRFGYIEPSETHSPFLGLVADHLCFDGQSIALLRKELLEELSGGQPQTPSSAEALSRRAHRELAGERGRKAVEFWEQRYDQLLAEGLPSDPFAEKEDRAKRHLVELTPAQAEALETLARHAEKATQSALWMALVIAVIARHREDGAACLGLPFSGRADRESLHALGCFANVLPIAITPDMDAGFDVLLKQVGREILSIMDVQDYPLTRLIQGLSKHAQGPADLPFDAVSVIEIHEDVEDVTDIDVGAGKFPLLIALVKFASGTYLAVEHQTAAFSVDWVKRFTDRFLNFACALARDPSQPIGDVDLIPADEKHLLETAFNATQSDYPRDSGLGELLAQRINHPDSAERVALEDGRSRITYRELGNRLAAISAELDESGVRAGETVGLAAARGLDSILTILGLVWHGAAYLPIDRSLPARTVADLMNECDARTLLCDPRERARLSELEDSFQVTSLPKGGGEDQDGRARDAVPAKRRGHDLAYVMFTSGSTGKPKGVLVPNRAVARLVLNNVALPFGPEDVIAQAASLGFDASTLEIWAPLLNGGRLQVIEDDTLFDPNALKDTLDTCGVTSLWLTSSLFNRIADDLPTAFASLERLMTGGEALSPAHVMKVMQACPNLTLINGYGPTENTTFTCTHRITGQDVSASNIPIGRPIGNTRVYVLDSRSQVAPTDCWGTLHAAGDGLALGYSGAPERTARSFVQYGNIAEERLYRTGDRARWRSDGTIEFGGRGDGQVKIRGHRIELAAVEQKFSELEGIRNICVLTMGKGADAFLGAAIAADCDHRDSWIAAAARALPEYMIPERVVVLDHLPVNANGKVDRKALHSMIASAEDTPVQAATANSASEQLVLALFESLFAGNEITPASDFFALGGHSLIAMRLAGLIEKETGFRPKLQDIFTSRTVANLAALVDSQGGTTGSSSLPRARGERFPLSSGQARLWVLQRMQPDLAVYSVPATLQIDGSVDAEALQRALHALEERQHALRLRFRSDPGHPDGVSQYLAPGGSWSLRRHRMDEASARSFIACEAARPFDLDDVPMARADLITLASDRHWLMISLHHAICDGWSMPILLQELTALYQAEAASEAAVLPELERHYEDFASWQRAYLESDAGKEALARWKDRLTPLPEPLDLPTDRPRGAERRFAGGFHDFTFDAETTQLIEEKAERSGTTAFSILTALVQLLLHRHCGQTDIPLGMLVAGREHSALDSVIGFFVNTVLLRQSVDPGMRFDDHLAVTSRTIMDALSDQAVPFEDIVSAVNAPRELSRNPLFDVLVAWQDGIPEMGKLGDAELSLVETAFPFSKFDLGFYFWRRHGRLQGQIEFDSDLFDRETIAALVERLNILCRSALASGATTAVSRLPMMPEGERDELDRFNATTQDLPIERSIPEPFLDQVRRTPDAVALQDGRESLTYTEFARRASGIATKLAERSVRPGQVVGLAMRRSVDMLAAIHGILLAGAAYSPLDPDHPEQRRREMLEDLGDGPVLTTPDLVELFDDGRVLVVEGHEDTDIPELAGGPDDLAYVLFTSGSTGRPKGVEIAHRGVLNRILWMQDAFPIGPDDVVLQKTPITFDVSVWELFWWSWTGAKLVLPPPGAERDPQQLAETIHDNGVTTLHFVPSMLATFLFAIESGMVAIDKLSSLRRVFASGEALDAPIVERFNDLLYERFGTELHNLYGPTEATVDVTWQPCSPSPGRSVVPIGKPIANTTVQILTEELQPLPIGVTGEIVLGGVQVARGYRNRPELSAEKFPEDPCNPGQRLYRTGDLGRWRRDGTIEYLGRIDHQVKIRGFRIECGEVEAALESHPSVERAPVKAVKIGELDELHAFILGSDDLTPLGLRDYLRGRLPEYMMPARFFVIEHLPLTSSGKIDRKALAGAPLAASPNAADRSAEAAVESTEKDDPQAGLLEAQLTRFWQEVLPDVAPAREDGFFDVGGNSLLLLRLFEKIEARWPGKLRIADLFANPSIARQAELLAGQSADAKSGDLAEAAEVKLAEFAPIAVIGMGVQLAGAEDLDAFWRDIAEGQDHVRPLPVTREAETRALLSAIGIKAPKHFREAAYLESIFDFDAQRFRMAPADASLLDPEQRLFMETALMALENAGYGGNALRGQRVGVFAGGGANPAWRLVMEHAASGKAEQAFALNVPSNIVARLSYLKDWHGPARVIDTACSSSLVAVHDACQSLRDGSSRIAIAGGAKLLPCPSDADSAFTIDSSTARTRAFDADADGTGVGEGSAVFVLKPLDAAMKDGDPVHAVIRGSAVNQDGASSGAAAPNPMQQAEVIRQAAESADIDLSSLSYFEAHGTGTSLGDPIEIDGITRAFEGRDQLFESAFIGSGKGNYGHLDGAAGALGLARAILALRHDRAPPQPFFENPNPKIDFDRSPVRVPERLEKLPDRGQARRAGVSSFGLSGINAHMVVEAAQAFIDTISAHTDAGLIHVVALSAGSEAALRDYAAKLHQRIRSDDSLAVRDIAFTLATGRDDLKYRFAVAVQNREELLDQLTQLADGRRQAGFAKTPGEGKAGSASATTAAEAQGHIIRYLDGAPLGWPDGRQARRVSLPSAPFVKKPCKPDFKAGQRTLETWLRGPVETATAQCFSLAISDPDFWPVNEHKLNGQPTLVGMAVPALIAQAVKQLDGGGRTVGIDDLTWHHPLVASAVPDGKVTLSIYEDGQVELAGRLKNGKWRVFATARWNRHVIASNRPGPDLTSIRGKATVTHSLAGFTGQYGPVAMSERWDCSLSFQSDPESTSAIKHLRLADKYHTDLDDWLFHPALADVACSMALDIMAEGSIPLGIERVMVHGLSSAEVFACGQLHSPGKFDVTLFDADSLEPVLTVTGIRFGNAGGEARTGAPEPLKTLWETTAVRQQDIPEGCLFITDGDFWPVPHGCRAVHPDDLDRRVLSDMSHAVLALQPGSDAPRRNAEALRSVLRNMSGGLRLVTLGCGAFQMAGDDVAMAPDQSGTAGVVTAVAHEEPRLAISYADMTPETLRSCLGAELACKPARDPVTVYRDESCFVRKLVPLEESDRREDAGWPDYGVCLVTGGTGGFALALAEEMSAGGKVHLALLGRRDEAGLDEDTRRGLEALRGKGMGLSLFACDVADSAELGKTLDRIRKELGPITAVVHAAGIADGGFLALRDMAQFDAVQSAKVAGAVNLDQLTRNDPLQAFMMFGSLTAVVGAPGQTAYSAANAYLDGFAQLRRNQGRPAQTIDWCALSDQGMAARNDVPMQEGAWIRPGDAARLWRSVLGSSTAQLTMLDPVLLQDDPQSVPEAITPSVSSQAALPPAVESDVEARIAKIWAAVLGYDSVAPQDDFFALGGDSITGMQIVDEINGELGLSLTLSDLFTASSVSEVAALARSAPDGAGRGGELPEDAAGTGDRPAAGLEKALAAIWAETLGYDAVDPDEDFYALGGDSITGMEITDRIVRELGHEVSLTDLFEHSSIRKLKEKLAPSDGEAEAVKDSPLEAEAETPADVVDQAPPEEADPRCAPELSRYPLALEQLSVMNAAQKGNMGTAFNLPHAFVLGEDCDLDGLRAAIRSLTERHEILRTRILPDGDDWQMEVLPAAQVISELPVTQVNAPVEEACTALVEPFDLENEIPVRWRFLADPSGKTALFFDIHHILADAFSVERLLGELFALHCGEDLAPLRYQLRDYAWWSHTDDNRQRLASAKSYWQSLYADSLPKLDLPADRRRPAYHTFRGDIVGFELDPELLGEARKFAANQRVTMFTLVLTTWFVVLSRLAETEDLVIGVPVDARDATGFRDVAGMMVSLLPLRMQVRGRDTVEGLLARMQHHHVNALRHRAYFLDQLLDDLSPPAAPDRTLLSEVTLSYMNYQAANPGSDSSGIAPKVISLDRRHSKNDISIFVRDLPERMAITFDYYADLYDRARIEQLGEVFSNTLKRLIHSNAQQVGSIELLPEDQTRHLQVWENGPAATVPDDTSLFGLFASKVTVSPEHCAARDSEGAWTYSELLAEARAVARHLAAAGVEPGDFIAMHVERGRQAIAAMLGVAAIGAGYVPLDPAYPVERNRFILEDSGARIVLVDDVGQAAFAEMSDCVAQVCHVAEIPPDDGSFEPPALQDPHAAPAYLMYTSGSTGQPKGVLIEQGAVLRLALGEDYAWVAPGDVVAQAGPLSFDAATFEIWTTLLCGAEIAVIDRHTLLDPAAFARSLERFGVDKMFMSVGLFNRQIDHDPASLSGLKVLMIGGDSISKSHARRFMEACPDTQLLNAYGPTESTTFTTVTRIRASELDENMDSTVIGRPIADTRTVIRDESGLRVPIGAWGELQIGGDRLAREYWGRPELTAERFVPDPDCPSARLYRTGDLARWTRDGRIEFGGRRDNQVKLRGFRIELDEIEQQLRQAPSIRNAVALFNPDGLNGSEIIACIQESDEAGTVSDSRLGGLQAWLGQRLPSYMLPAKWYLVDDIPITENGKVDRKALLDRVLMQSPIDAQGPDEEETALAPTEQLVADIFSEVFETTIQSRNASFAVLGGHSLMAIRIVNRIMDRTGKRLSMADFFANPSIAGLARHIDDMSTDDNHAAGTVIPPAPKMDVYPTSHAQRRLYLLSQMEAGSGAYGMLFALRCSGALKAEALQSALRALVERHETLRTAFIEQDGSIVQRIDQTTSPTVAFNDVSDHSDPLREALRLAREEAATPVALDRPPLIRAQMIKVGSDEQLLILATHHIVGDGWSSRILLRELNLFYQAALGGETPDLAPLPITYKDFAHWQVEQNWLEAAAYWRAKLEGAPEQIKLPTDRPAPEVQSYRGAHVHLPIAPEVLSGLHGLAQARNTTLSAVGLAIFSAMLYRLTRQQDMVIGMGVAGRERTETEGLIGFFVNVLPIRVHLDEESDLEALIDDVHLNITSALDRQDYPFDELVRAVAPKRHANRQPLVNVVFEYQRFDALARMDENSGLPAISSEREGLLSGNLDKFVDNTTAKHDLILFLTEEAGQARFTLEYDTDLFEAQTMQRWLGFLERFARAAAENFHKDS